MDGFNAPATYNDVVHNDPEEEFDPNDYDTTALQSAIEAAVRLYGVERILCGTDGSSFGYEWTANAVQKAQIGQSEKTQILDGNARRLLAAITPLIH